MRVLQLIDSLRPGGAERMAVSYANALSSRTEGSFLCATRMEGSLKTKLKDEVGYLFLRKRSLLDPGAILRLLNFIKKNKITIVQAHSSSVFLACFIKLTRPELKLVWHDHYGKDIIGRKTFFLKIVSDLLDGVIAVNKDLREWSVKELKVRKAVFIKNFLPIDVDDHTSVIPLLKGRLGFRIICLANLRPQKDHLNLLKAFSSIIKGKEEISLHLVGKDDENIYSRSLKEYNISQNLRDQVFLYGEQENVNAMLDQADLGVLSSTTEGLPVALLEYGRAGLPVVCTRVGQCEEVIEDFGRLVTPGNSEALAEELLYYINNKEKRMIDAAGFHKKVMKEYSETAIMPEVLRFFAALGRPSTGKNGIGSEDCRE